MFQGDEKRKQIAKIEAAEKEEWNDFYNGISKRISEVRLEKNIGVADLGDKADIDASHIYRVEKNQKHAGLISLVKIARGLGVSVDDLLPIETESEETKRIKHILNECNPTQLREINKYLDQKYGRK